ncbi:hypothetical protein ACRALDRAFT_1075321 [Sodiomyces alcalophilus JCM 7366]|uniref:uncharacterized protein n=1 Tax=Sodiomyces alcalophilus JCM 7366 TaxID=591952 RepID=UPI0039B62D55
MSSSRPIQTQHALVDMEMRPSARISVAAMSILRRIARETECIICRETMARPRVIPCGHAFCENCTCMLKLRNVVPGCPFGCREGTHRGSVCWVLRIASRACAESLMRALKATVALARRIYLFVVRVTYRCLEAFLWQASQLMQHASVAGLAVLTAAVIKELAGCPDLLLASVAIIAGWYLWTRFGYGEKWPR